MKKIFTLLTFVCASMIATKSFAQISETFETSGDVTNMINECWTFTTVSHNNSAPIDGIGSVTSQLNATSQIASPYLNLGSSVTLSFDYQRVAVSGGSRTLKIYLVDTSGTQTILDNLVLNDASFHTYSSSFDNSNTPGNHFPLKGKIMFQFSNNVSVTFDDLTISANYFYAGGCAPSQSPLPVKLVSFQGNLNNGKISLQWTVAENEMNDRFEVQRSVDGKVFETASVIAASAKYGSENYYYNEAMNADKSYYRLKMFDKNEVVNYSKILVFKSTMVSNSAMKIINNPTIDKLTMSYTSASNQAAQIRVYDMAGRLQMSQALNLYTGSNLISVQLNSAFKTGIYVVEITATSDRQTAKFVKQ